MTTTTHAQVTVGVSATIAAYAQALDSGRTDEVVALFTPDGTADIAGVGTYQGHEAIREGYAGMVPRRPQLHLIGNTVVTSWSDDEATVSSDFTFFLKGSSGWSVPVTGHYVDVLRLSDDGTWRFSSKIATYG